MKETLLVGTENVYYYGILNPSNVLILCKVSDLFTGNVCIIKCTMEMCKSMGKFDNSPFLLECKKCKEKYEFYDLFEDIKILSFGKKVKEKYPEYFI